MYQVHFSNKVMKCLDSITSVSNQRIVEKAIGLKTDPRPVGVKLLKNKKDRSYRIRVGDYRIVYDINDVLKRVEIIDIGHRRDIYR